VHVGDGRGAHVLPPKALRGSCFVIQPFDEMVATLDPQLIEARRPPADLAGHLAAGVVDQHRVGPAFSYNDLLLLASVADTSDRPAKAIEPIGEYPRGQDDREAILGAHFDLAGPEAIPCSGLVVRSLPDEVSRALPRARRHVPDAWQQAVRPGEPLDEDVRRLGPGSPKTTPVCTGAGGTPRSSPPSTSTPSPPAWTTCRRPICGWRSPSCATWRPTTTDARLSTCAAWAGSSPRCWPPTGVSGSPA
jgi:hypothetical protein